MKGNLLDYGNHGLGLRAMYDGDQSARTAASFLVGQESIDLAAAQAGLVNAQTRAYVLKCSLYWVLRSLPFTP